MAQNSNHLINQQIKRTARDSLIYIPSKIIPAIVGIALIRVLTTIFTPEEYGHYQVTLTTFGLIRVFSMVWLGSSVTRFFLGFRKENNTNIFFSTLFLASIFGILIVTGISYGLNFLFFKQKIAAELFSLINLAIVASAFSAFFEIFVTVFRAGLEPKKYTFFWIMFSMGKPFIGIALILMFDFRVEGIFWGFLVAPLLLDIVIFLKLNLSQHFKIVSFSKSLLNQFFRYGVPISFSLLSFWILSLSDRYFIEFFRGSGEVGFYSVGYTISEKTLNFLYMILMLAAYPIIVDNWERFGEKHTQNLITELTRIFFIICMPVLVTLVFIPEEIFLIFSDSKFLDGAKILPLISLGVFLNGLTQYVLKGFELRKKSIKIAMLALFAGLSNVILNLILIPKYGTFGAGISACFAYIVYFISAVYFSRSELLWKPPYQSIGKIIFAGLIFGIFLNRMVQISPNTLVTVFCILPIGMFIFYGTLCLIQEVRSNEIRKGLNYLNRLIKG